MKSLLLAASLFVASFFGGLHAANPLSITPSAAAVVFAENKLPASPPPAVTLTALPTASTQADPTITTSTVPGVPTQTSYVTQDELAALSNNLRALIYSVAASSTTAFTDPQIAADGNGVYYGEAAAPVTQLSNITLNGVSGLTSADIPELPTSKLTDFAYATSTDFVPGIAAWGDSLTQGAGYTYPDELSVLTGVPVSNEGIAGQTSAQIAARMLAATSMYSWPAIIWTGRNDISGVLATDEPNILNSIASMVAALQSVGNSNYIILSIPNASTEPSGSTNYNEIIQINSDIASAYGSHYLDQREYLVTNGLSAAGITPSTQDLADISNDVPPTDLRADGEHPNATGNQVIAELIYQHIGLLIPITSSAPILTSKNISLYLENPPTFPLLDTQEGYAQDGSTILFASSANQNTFVGDGAGQNLPTTTISLAASYNTAIGYQALTIATSSTSNTAVGRWALQVDTSGSSNNAVGQGSLVANTTGSNNNGIGVDALFKNTTGSSNSAVGSTALFSNTTGTANAAFGSSALFANTTGTHNAAFGGLALDNNTTGSQNTAIGYTAEQFNVSATNTVAIGYEAGTGSAGNYNDQGVVTIGEQSGFNLQTNSDYNTFLGYEAGFNITTGNDNIILGASPNVVGGTNTHVTTGSNDILLGFNANTPTTTQSNFLNIGGVLFGTLPATSSVTSFSVSSSGKIAVGTSTPYARLTVWGADAASSTLAFNVVNNASTTVFAVFDGGNAQLSGTLTQSSDQRLKTNVQSLDASSSLSLIDALNPVTFNWIDPNEGTTPQLGFIAQQVQQIFPNLVSTTSPTMLTPDGTLGLNYIGLISPIVKSIQALYADIQNLEQTVAGFAQRFTTNQLCVNKSDGTPVCVTGDQLSALLAAQEQEETPSPSPAGDTASTTPPTITIDGDNPAVINVGATYTDLGATAADAEGHSLDVQAFLNGVEAPSIVMDTSEPATDTIEYVATDTWGNTSTSSRSLIIEAAAQ